MKTNISGEAVVFGTLYKDPEDVDYGENSNKLPHHSDSDKLVENFIKIKSVKIQSQFLF